ERAHRAAVIAAEGPELREIPPRRLVLGIRARMARVAYRLELQNLHDQVLLLGSMVDKAVGRAMDSLSRRDFELARAVIAEDAIVNRKRFQIEEQSIHLIATQQPMASDLRAIIAILSIVVDLERIGDYEVGIAKITLMHG